MATYGGGAHRKIRTFTSLNFKPSHHLQHKLSVVRTLVRRADQLVTSEEDREMEKVRQALGTNDYQGWAYKIPKCRPPRDQAKDTDRRSIPSVSISYIRRLSEKLKKIVISLSS